MALGKITERIIDAIQAFAEAGDDSDKIGAGDPTGLAIAFPGAGSFKRGLTWLRERTGTPGFIDFLIEAIGDEHDRAAIAHANITTNATTVAPTLTHNIGFSGVSKNEGNSTLTLTLDPVYDNTGYFVWGFIFGLFSVQLLSSQGTSSFTLRFQDAAGVNIGINGRSVRMLTVGLQRT